MSYFWFSGDFNFWERKFLVFDFLAISFLGAKVSVLISGNLHLERLFHLGFWKSMRSMVMLQRGARKRCIDMHGFLRT